MKENDIKKYLSGECTFEEEQRALETLSTEEGLETLNNLADEFWESDLDDYKIDDKRLYKKITTKIDGKESRFALYLKYAAVALILVAATFLVINKSEEEKTLPIIAPSEFVVKSTTKGQKSTIMLSDGSKVILNAGSKLQYFRNFTDSTRNIELIGEAFFQVAKDKSRPFTVTTGTTKTTALGTSFNINSRSSVHKISLATGKVEVNTDLSENVFTLTPGEALNVNTDSGFAHQFQFDMEKELSWKDGVLYFDDTKLQEIITTLEYWYDVKIEVANKNLLSKKYTGRFENSSLKHVLESMSFALDFKYDLNKKVVKIIK
ncbi:MAG: FecR domain-containing protein [Cyclobacteriaceae bacterium]|nr:FecR domain-containing protein [Cyclobacteriaceae bacterium]